MQLKGNLWAVLPEGMQVWDHTIRLSELNLTKSLLEIENLSNGAARKVRLCWGEEILEKNNHPWGIGRVTETPESPKEEPWAWPWHQLGDAGTLRGPNYSLCDSCPGLVWVAPQGSFCVQAGDWDVLLTVNYSINCFHQKPLTSGKGDRWGRRLSRLGNLAGGGSLRSHSDGHGPPQAHGEGYVGKPGAGVHT